MVQHRKIWYRFKNILSGAFWVYCLLSPCILFKSDHIFRAVYLHKIICGYLGFELLIFLSLSFSCCCFLIRVVSFRCFIGFLVNPFDIKSHVPLHALPLFSLLISGGLFSSGPMLLQTTKLTEKFPLGILDPARNLQ